MVPNNNITIPPVVTKKLYVIDQTIGPSQTYTSSLNSPLFSEYKSSVTKPLQYYKTMWTPVNDIQISQSNVYAPQFNQINKYTTRTFPYLNNIKDLQRIAK